MIELLVQSTPKGDPVTTRFDERIITIGRDPSSTLRFDMGADLEVSTRHAEILEHDGAYVIVDKDSTNGTWVNGAELRGRRALNVGDVINLGRRGPTLRVVAFSGQLWHPTVESKVRLPPLHSHPTWRPHRTKEWLVKVVETRTRSLRLAVAGAVAGVLVLGLLGWYYVRRQPADDVEVWREVTVPAIRRANDDAVVLIETEIPGPACRRGCEGTGFSISGDGLIVTNRHVVIQQGTRATRIRVKFANTGVWVSAHLVRAARDGSADVALIQVDEPGEYPSVVGVSARGPDLPVGSTVMMIGFPLGTTLKMEGAGERAVAKTTLTLGSIGKALEDEFQIDAFADHGSSGSPVFDRHGHAIGVVSGGARNANDKIVYVVPSTRIWQLRNAAAD